MVLLFFFLFQAEDGIRDAQESRGLGDVYKRQAGADIKGELQEVKKLVLAETHHYVNSKGRSIQRNNGV